MANKNCVLFSEPCDVTFGGKLKEKSRNR